MSTIRVNKAPPMERRPRCAGCVRRLRPYWKTIKEESVPAPEFRRYTVEWQGQYHAYGAFCTLRCAADFANAVVKNRKAVK